MLVQPPVLLAVMIPQSFVAFFGFPPHCIDVPALRVQPLLELFHLCANSGKRTVKVENWFADQKKQRNNFADSEKNFPFFQLSHPQRSFNRRDDSQKLRALFFRPVRSLRLGNGLFSCFFQQLV